LAEEEVALEAEALVALVALGEALVEALETEAVGNQNWMHTSRSN